MWEDLLQFLLRNSTVFDGRRSREHVSKLLHHSIKQLNYVSNDIVIRYHLETIAYTPKLVAET